MTPRCLKCEGSHRTQDCHTTERLQTLHCINCNEDGHMASSRQCPKFPKLKLKQKTEETQTNKTINQTRPVTAEISCANICSNKTKQQMAPREEAPKTSNQTPNEKQQETPNFLNFATYINELQNLTSKFPEIFWALKDMSKTMISKNSIYS
ncbi:hypothetical protein TNCV_756921 [Trichonephila clavipes]|nr:hypothetical protein TNCV_756921 [Trichonephila clavipes]